MKKHYSALCHLLALCLFLTACGGPAAPETTPAPTIPVEERIAGSWETAIDCTDISKACLLENMGQELAANFDVSGVCLTGLLTLQSDGSFTMTIQEEAVQAFSQQVKEKMSSGLHGYLEKTLEKELAGFTLDAYLNATGLTIDDLLVMAGLDLERLSLQMLEPMRTVPCSGTFQVKEDKMYIAGTVCDFSFTQDSLQFSAPEEATAPFPALFPLTFQRVS